MLVISRKRNERVRVTIDGRELWVMIVEIRGDKVRLGFDAERAIEIRREEHLVEDPRP